MALLLSIVFLDALHAILGIGGPEMDAPMRKWGSSAVYVLVAAVVSLRAISLRDARGPWTLLAVGISLYSAGNLLWSFWLEHMAAPPIPSVSDGMWLALYPLSYVAIVALARASQRRAPAGVWLDGIVAGLGIAALGAALVFSPVLNSASGSPAAVATELAYPVVDLLLAGLVVGVLALRAWRLDRAWSLLGGGFLTLAVADCLYLVQVANGASAPSPMTNLFYMGGVALLALAAWQPEGKRRGLRLEGWSMLFVPATFVLGAIGLLIYDHFHRLDPLALTLSIATVLTALARTALTFRDVRSLAETRRQAVTDDLTSLPNRRLFLRRLDEAIVAAKRVDGSVALLVIDLDHFKELNDTLGHSAGDLLLKEIGPRLRGVLRSTDTLARLGGDEFGLVLDVPCDEAAALRVAEKVREAMIRPFLISGLSLRVTSSVGIALYPAHGEDGQQLLQRADVAMYEAKATQSGCEVYVRERDTHSRERLALVGELARALEGDEIVLHFQPKAVAASRRIVGVEALVRWQHPEQGLLPPLLFVPLTEQAGLARALTRKVLDLALRQCSAWRRAGRDLHVAVNTTVADLLDAQFPVEVQAALARHALPPQALVLEVTENSVMSDPVRINDVLARLGELGVRLSLDDYGTGYSSLAHLNTLPVCEVKIDRSFVGRMGSSRGDAAIVESTIQLANNLGIRAVAEGVEDEATWERLIELGCELVQGYALSRPVPALELEPLLDAFAQRSDGLAAGASPAALLLAP
jgi:diguanylate cyclase (GGDEF)-like protein